MEKRVIKGSGNPTSLFLSKGYFSSKKGQTQHEI